MGENILIEYSQGLSSIDAVRVQYGLGWTTSILNQIGIQS